MQRVTWRVIQCSKPSVVSTHSSPNTVYFACCISTPTPNVTPLGFREIGTLTSGVCSAPEVRASRRLGSVEGCVHFSQKATCPHWFGNVTVSSSVNDQSPVDVPGSTSLHGRPRVESDNSRKDLDATILLASFESLKINACRPSQDWLPQTMRSSRRTTRYSQVTARTDYYLLISRTLDWTGK
ncbi:hypothetical protein BDW42DRAFT_189414 [Aspergillus taichungensis]|uniref:Uncharacterized protein n=1 Tax=Aspergillus taichungensis TaxID=482145 RepID=A0A2J5HE91_9EURO|nr:hypothetical protein BDW42DRAFT_189414 [Aspergillus taichungensis]